MTVHEKRAPWALRYAPLFTLVVWALAIGATFLVDPDHMRGWGTGWLIASVVASAYFTAGYTRFAKIITEDSQGDKHVSPEGLGMLSQALVFLILTTYLLVFRIINAQPAFVSPEMRFQYTVASIVFITVFTLQAGWAVLWTVRQVNARRALKRAAAVVAAHLEAT